MAKKTNYGFERRKREADRKAKQEQKLLRKRAVAEQKRTDAALAESQDDRKMESQAGAIPAPDGKT